jgi:DNA-binding CsgD family transcriptional regulator
MKNLLTDTQRAIKAIGAIRYAMDHLGDSISEIAKRFKISEKSVQEALAHDDMLFESVIQLIAPAAATQVDTHSVMGPYERSKIEDQFREIAYLDE